MIVDWLAYVTSQSPTGAEFLRTTGYKTLEELGIHENSNPSLVGDRLYAMGLVHSNPVRGAVAIHTLVTLTTMEKHLSPWTSHGTDPVTVNFTELTDQILFQMIAIEEARRLNL